MGWALAYDQEGELKLPGYVGEALWDGARLLTKRGELKLS